MGREVLKWIAILTMTIDHLGAALYPELLFLRYIGRISFPIFCYLLVLGMETTRDVRNYFIRLFLFAIISQVPYYLALGFEPFESLNIFFTLSSGVLLIYSVKHKSTPALFLLVCMLLASVMLNFDYNIYGIALIGSMLILKENMVNGIISLIFLNILFLSSIITWSPQILSLFALPLILLHRKGSVKNIEQGNWVFVYPSWRKFFFYVYYPLHLIFLYLVKVTYF